MFNILIQKIHKLSRYFERKSFREHCWNNDAWLLKKYNLPKLTRDEYQNYCDTWSCFKVSPKDLAYVRMYKKEYGFDPYFIPDYEFYRYVIPRTNPSSLVTAFKNKALYEVYFAQMPIIQNVTACFVGGGKYKNGMIQITKEEELELLMQLNSFIIKPAFDSGCGKNVKKIDLTKVKNKEEYLNHLIQEYKSDYVTQEVLVQHPDIARLNPRSLNCCRVTSILLNNRFSYSTILKVGKSKSDVDNWQDSYVIGVDTEGKLLQYGYDSELNRVEQADNGIPFRGIQLPKYNEMIMLAEKFHRFYFPNIGILGWDMCVDINNDVRVVEINVDYPGVAGEQMASGTFFKDRRDDILNLLV